MFFASKFQVEKIDSDLNYAVLKLSNKFSESFENGLPSEVYIIFENGYL